MNTTKEIEWCCLIHEKKQKNKKPIKKWKETKRKYWWHGLIIKIIIKKAKTICVMLNKNIFDIDIQRINWG